MKSWKIIVFAVLAAILMAVPVMAQSDDSPSEPPVDTESGRIGTVTGQIIDATNGSELPDGLATMLHVWDGDYNEKLMLHGQSEADGTFQFDDVPFEPGYFYAAMVDHEEVTYFSMPAGVPETDQELNLEVSVYEATTDTSQVQIENMHVFFDSAPAGLFVAEIYSISNLGNETVAHSISLEDGTAATLKFDLPDDAADVKFDGNGDGRFATVPGGFVDTGALVPGQSTSQIAVSYVLPYSDGMTYSRTFEFPMVGVKYLLAAGIGLELGGEGLVPDGTRQMGEGQEIAVFTAGSAEAGDSQQVTISGEMKAATVPASSEMRTEAPAAAADSSGSNIALGGILLGLVLIGVGLWWYRQQNAADAEFEATGYHQVVGPAANMAAVNSAIAPAPNGLELDSDQPARQPVTEAVGPEPNVDMDMATAGE